MPLSKDQPRLQDRHVMAVREYILDNADLAEKIVVRIGIPQLRGDGRYECGAEIDDGDSIDTKYMNGDDAFESIQLALILIGTELKFITDRRGGSVSWSNNRRHDIGFPTYPDLSMTPILTIHEQSDSENSSSIPPP